MKQVAAYIRVSTDGQVGEDKFGLETQKGIITEYCEKNGMEIIRWFSDEGESGAKAARISLMKCESVSELKRILSEVL